MKLQATIGGYAGKPVTLTGFYDPDTESVAIISSAPMTDTRIAPDYAVVSNLRLPACDMQFDDAGLALAIRCYFAGRDQGAVVLADAVQRFDPSGKIEVQGVDESGPKYAIANGIENGQVAVLA